MNNSRKLARRSELVQANNQSLYRSYPSENLSPQKLATILRELDSGHCSNAMNLFDDMEEKDLHLAAVMQTRVMAAAAPQRRIVPASDDADHKRHADFINEVWEGIQDNRRIISDLLSAIGRGFSIAEMMFELREGSLIVDRIKLCPQSLFSFIDPENSGLLLEFPRYQKPGLVHGEALPREKFIFHAHRTFGGSVLRSGLYRGIAWYYLFTSFSIKDWMSFMDLYGIPLRLGKFKPSADDRSREILKKAVMNLGSDAAAVISEDTTIEFIESRLSGSHDLFRNAVEFFNRQKSKRVLGQTLTTEQGSSGSYSLGSVHDRVRADITRLDCIMLDETLTRDFVIPLVKANFGRQKNYPSFTCEPDGAEKNRSRLDDMKKLYDMGVPLAVGEVYKAAGIPEPSPSDSIHVKNAEPKQ